MEIIPLHKAKDQDSRKTLKFQDLEIIDFPRNLESTLINPNDFILPNKFYIYQSLLYY